MCVAATARRVRRNMKLDKRYRSWRKDVSTQTRKNQAKWEAEKLRQQKAKK